MRLVGRKNKKEAINKEVNRLTYAYTFLLSAAVIFILSLKSFTFNILGNHISYAIFMMPFIYFLVELIMKEIGYKPAKIAVLVSTVVVYISSILIDVIFGVKFSILNYFGITFAYFLSQFLNLSIYYYMLDNYKTPLFFVILNMIFCLLINNMLYMLFTSGMVFTDTFWTSYTLVVILQFIICVVLSIIINLVRQGIEID